MKRLFSFLVLFSLVLGVSANASHDPFDEDTLNFNDEAFYFVETSKTTENYFGFQAQNSLGIAVYEKLTPASETRICGFDLKVQRVHNNPTNNARLAYEIRQGGSHPFDSSNFIAEQDRSIEHLPASTSATFDYIQFPLPLSGTNITNGCTTLLAGGTYWLKLRNFTETALVALKLGIHDREFGNRTGFYPCVVSACSGNEAVPQKDLQFRLYTDNPVNVISQQEFLFFPSSASYNFTDTDFGILGNFFRDVIVWAFFPSESSINRFADLADDIENKPPIGYFTEMKDTINNLNIGTASVSYDTSAIAGIVNPLKTGLSFILWFLLGVWLFKRIAHLDL